MDRINSFSYNGFSASTNGVYVISKDNFDVGGRELIAYSVIGRDGDLIVDMGRCKQFDITYQCRCMNAKSMPGIKSQLLSEQGKYHTLSDTYSGDTFSAYVKAMSIKYREHNVADFSITFSCYEVST